MPLGQRARQEVEQRKVEMERMKVGQKDRLGLPFFLEGEMETEGEDLPVSFGLTDYKVIHFGSSLGTVKQ